MVFLVEVACFAGSTYVKNANIKGIIIEDTNTKSYCIRKAYSRRTYTKSICFEDICIGEISTYVGNIFTWYTYSKNISIGGVCIKVFYVENTFVLGIGSEDIINGSTLTKSICTKDVFMCCWRYIYVY